MVLANFNVEECLVEQIKNYLGNSSWTFAQLKNLILGKKSIAELLIRIDVLLSKAEATDLEKIQQTLEAESYKKQLEEDEQENKNERLQKTKDEQIKERFNQELKKIATTIEQHLEEQQVLTQRMNQFSLSQIALGRYSSYPQTNQWQYSIHQYEAKIHFLTEKRKIIRDKLQEIEQRSTLYTHREQTRNLRKQAGITYQNTQQNIEQSLSEKNRELLKKKCMAHSQSLKKKKTQLNLAAERMHFDLFLQQVSEYLSLMKLSLKEKSALQAIIKLSQKHSQYQNDLILFRGSLTKKKSLISNQLVQLHGLKDKFRLLTKQNPTITNEEITDKIKTLSNTLEKSTTIQKRLNTFSLLLLGLSCLFSIPLILALSGTLTIFTPVLLYCLVSIPPALFLLSTISLGIASLVYVFKIKETTESIKNNKLLISSNFKQENKKELDLKELELVTIPTMEKQIKKEETLRDELIKTVEKTQKQLNDSLAQAQRITPTSTDNLSLFKVSNSHEYHEPDFDLSTLLSP